LEEASRVWLGSEEESEYGDRVGGRLIVK